MIALQSILAQANAGPASLLTRLSAHYGWRIAMIATIAVLAHLTVRVIRTLLRLYLTSSYGRKKRIKATTLAHFITSAMIFVIYFAACGLIFRELKISLTAYIASATVIGFAVSFGAQGVIQDVITGLTLITSDLLDVDDMVDIGGQGGIVSKVGVRFVVLTNFTGAEVFVPNRNVANVINYQRGYIRAFVDVRLPSNRDNEQAAVTRLQEVAQAVAEQYAGLMLREHEILALQEDAQSLVRIKFRIWPGQGALIETSVRQAILFEMKRLYPDYADWMVSIQYRVENDDLKPADVTTCWGKGDKYIKIGQLN